MLDPYFAVTVPFDVTKAYAAAKNKGVGFFAKYLHDCMKAINSVENLRLRIIDDEIVEITELEGDRFFWFQIIAGDKVDGYDGCPGIGKVRGERMAAGWNTVEEAWADITAEYEKKGCFDGDALFNARMARTLRHGEYKKGKPVLWTPPAL